MGREPVNFASAADIADKQVTFAELAPGRAYAYTAEGDPNTGVIVGDHGVMVVDTQATPAMAADVIARIKSVTDRPVTHVLLSHYHAVRVLGASAYHAHTIIASRDTYELIKERGEQDKASEIGRFPRLFRGVESVPAGMTWPTLTFSGQLSVDLGGVTVEIRQVGRGHTKGDTIAWLPEQRILYSGDLVEHQTTCYCGDAYLRDWPAALDALTALRPEKLVPGRGDALLTAADCRAAIASTRAFIGDLYAEVTRAAVGGRNLKAVYQDVYARLSKKYGQWVIFEHCMPFDVSRAYDEVTGHEHPRIWTDVRDREMWAELTG